MADRFLGLTGSQWLWVGIAILIVIIVIIIIAVVAKNRFTKTNTNVGASSAIAASTSSSSQGYETLGPYVPFPEGGSSDNSSISYEGSTTSAGESYYPGSSNPSELDHGSNYSPSNNTITHEAEVVNLGVFEEGRTPNLSEDGSQMAGPAESSPSQGWSPVSDDSNHSEDSSYGGNSNQRPITNAPSSFY